MWHLEPSLTDPDTVYAGVEDAALFRSTDGGQTWQELAGLRSQTGDLMAAGRRRDVPAYDLAGSEAIPNVSSLRFQRQALSDRTMRGKTWKPINRGLQVAVHS